MEILRSKKKPETIYARVVVLGETGVGKTCFCDMFVLGRTFIYYDPTGHESSRRILEIDKIIWQLEFMDLNSAIYREEYQLHHPVVHDNMLTQTHGLILIYDVTSKDSFEKVTNHAYFYTWGCRTTTSDGDEKKLERKALGCVLVGNKLDILRSNPEKREVDQEMAEQWAESQGFKHIEITTDSRKQVENAVELLTRDIKKINLREEREAARKKEAKKREQKEREEDSRKQRKKALTDAVKRVLPIGSK